MSSPGPDPTLEALAKLDARGPSRDVDERVLASGRRIFERGDGEVGAWLRDALARFVVPVFLAGTAAVYLTCAIRAASALYR